MGHAFAKDTVNPRTGLASKETRLLKQTWRYFCDHNRNFGALILHAFFQKQPDTLHLFRNFRGKPIQNLPEDMLFRTHACTFGYQLTSIVDNSDDADLLEALIRKNAEVHKKHLGVTPMHFRIMGKTVVDVLQAKNGKLMTPGTVLAWEKLFNFIATITTTVLDPSKADSNPSTPSKKLRMQRSVSRTTVSSVKRSKSKA